MKRCLSLPLAEAGRLCFVQRLGADDRTGPKIHSMGSPARRTVRLVLGPDSRQSFAYRLDAGHRAAVDEISAARTET